MLDKSLEELEGFQTHRSFGTELAQRVLALRRIPIGQLTPSAIRLLISQREGPSYVLPLAMEILERDPWSEVEFYPGDLLAAVIRLGSADWPPGTEWRDRLLVIIRRALDTSRNLSADDRDLKLEAELQGILEKEVGEGE